MIKNKLPLILSLMALLISSTNLTMTLKNADVIGSLVPPSEKTKEHIDMDKTIQVRTTSSDFGKFLEDTGIQAVGDYKTTDEHVFLIPNHYDDVMDQYSNWKKNRGNI